MNLVTSSAITMDDKINRANMRILDTGGYLVRTQAGFKKAVKHWLLENDFDHTDISDVEGYPKKYPSVVRIQYIRGFCVVNASCCPLNKHIKQLKMRISELSND